MDFVVGDITERSAVVRATEGVRVMWKGLMEERVGPRQSFRRIRTSRARFVVYDIVV